MKVPLADSFVGGKLLLFSVPPPLFLVYSCPCDLTWDASVLEQSALLPFFFIFTLFPPPLFSPYVSLQLPVYPDH